MNEPSNNQFEEQFLKRQIQQTSIQSFQPLLILLFNPVGECLLSLPALANIPEDVREQLQSLPHDLCQSINRRISAQFINHECWPYSIESYFAAAIKSLIKFFGLNLPLLLKSCFMQKMMNPLALLDLIDFKQGQSDFTFSNRDNLLGELEFYENTRQVWSAHRQNVKSIYWRRYELLSPSQQLELKSRIQAKLKNIYALSGTQLDFLYQLLPSFQQPWLLTHILGHSNLQNRHRKLVEYILSLRLIKTEEGVTFNHHNFFVHPKQITQENITYCVLNQINYFSLFSEGSYLEDGSSLYLKFNLFNFVSIDIGSEIFLFMYNRKENQLKCSSLQKSFHFLIDKITKGHSVFVYCEYNYFEELNRDKLIILLNKLLICYLIFFKQSQKIDLYDLLKKNCLDPQNFEIFSKIFAFLQAYQISEAEEANNNMLSLLKLVTADILSNKVSSEADILLFNFICVTNTFEAKKSTFYNKLLEFLIIFIPKFIKDGGSWKKFNSNELYELKWRAIGQQSQVLPYLKVEFEKQTLLEMMALISESSRPPKDPDNIFTFMKQYPASIFYYAEKLANVSALLKNFSKYNIFETKSNEQLLCLLGSYASQKIPSNEGYNQSIHLLLKEHSSLLITFGKDINWVKLARKIGLNLTVQLETNGLQVLNLLTNNKVVDEMEVSELCEKQNSTNLDLANIFKKVSYFRVLLFMYNGGFISKETVKNHLMILPQLEMLETISLRRIIEYQAQYSPTKMEEVKKINQNRNFVMLYHKICSLIERYNETYWLSVAQYSKEAYTQLLKNMDYLFEHLESSTDLNHIFKFVNILKTNPFKSAQKQPITFHQLYNYHKTLVFRILPNLWNKYKDTQSNLKDVKMGISYLEHVEKCNKSSTDAVQAFQNIIRSHTQSHLSYLIRFVFFGACCDCRQLILNNQQYITEKHRQHISISVICNVLRNLEEILSEQHFDFFGLVMSMIRYDLMFNVQQLNDIRQDEVITLDMQICADPILVLKSKQEASNALNEIFAKILKKLLNYCYNQQIFERVMSFSMYLLEKIDKDNKAYSQDWIESIFSKINQEMANEDETTRKFSIMNQWRIKIMDYLPDARKLKCYSSTYIKNELLIAEKLVIKLNDTYQMKQNVLKNIEQFIPSNISGCSNDTRTFLHVLLQFLHAAIIKTGYRCEIEHQLLSQIMHKIIKLKDPQFDIYIELFIKLLSTDKLASVFLCILEEQDTFMSMTADIQGYFLKQSKNKQNINKDSILTPISKFIGIFEIKYSHNAIAFSQLASKLMHKTTAFKNGQQKIYLTYSMKERLDNLWKPSELFRKAINSFLQKQQQPTLKLKTLQTIIYYHPNTLPYLLLYPINNGDQSVPFINYLIEQTNHLIDYSIYDFLHFICQDHSCILSNDNKPIFFAEYICYRIVRQVLKMDLKGNILLLLFYLTQIRTFSLISRMSMDQCGCSLVDDLINQLKQKRNGFERTGFDSVIIENILSVIYQQEAIYQKDQYSKRLTVISERKALNINIDQHKHCQIKSVNLDQKFMKLESYFLQFDYSHIQIRQLPQFEDFSILQNLDIDEIIPKLYNINVQNRADFEQILSIYQDQQHLKKVDKLLDIFKEHKGKQKKHFYKNYFLNRGQFSRDQGFHRQKDQQKDNLQAKQIENEFKKILLQAISQEKNIKPSFQDNNSIQSGNVANMSSLKQNPNLFSKSHLLVGTKEDRNNQTEFGQLQRPASYDSHNQKASNNSKFQFNSSCILPCHLFPQIREDLLFEIVLSLYYSVQTIGLEFILPFIENKKMQSKIINTLVFILRNPVNNKHFPSCLYEYCKQEGKWKKSENKNVDTILKDRIIKLLEQQFKFCFYENPLFLKQEVYYQGLHGIILQPNLNYMNLSSIGKHIPYFEILEILFDMKSQIINSFLYKITVIPDNLLSKLFDLLMQHEEIYTRQKKEVENKKNSWLQKSKSKFNDISLYQDIKALYANHNFIFKFRQVYPFQLKLPNPYFLTALINTPIYSFHEMQTIHINILKSKRRDRQILTFLNKVLQIYSNQDISCFHWLSQYRDVISLMIQHINRSSTIQNEPIYRLLKFPHIINFQTKVEIMQSELKEKSRSNVVLVKGYRTFRIQAKKDIFLKSFEKLKDKVAAFWQQQFQAKLEIQKELKGTGEGANKKWFTLTTQAMVNSDLALFTRTPTNFYYFNKKSHINPRHLEYFEFIGKLFGVSIRQPSFFICPSFSRILYKRILSLPIEIEDLLSEQYEEGEFYREMSVLQNLQSDLQFEEFGITKKQFTFMSKQTIEDDSNKLIANIEREKSEFKSSDENFSLLIKEKSIKATNLKAKGEQNMTNVNEEVIELLPRGACMQVNFDNRLEYLKVLREKLIDIVVKKSSKQYELFMKGLSTVVDPKILSIFSVDELRLLIEGNSEISQYSVDDLRKNIIIDKNCYDKTIQQFFEILKGLSAVDLAHFIHFWTGEPKVRSNGFRDMRMAINAAHNNEFTVKTCSNLLLIPKYASKDRLKEKISICIQTVKQKQD